MPLQPLLGAFCAVLLCAAAGAAREVQLLVDPGPSAAGLYLTPNTTSPPIFHHQLYGPIGGAKSFYHLSQWNTPQNLPVKASSQGNGPCLLNRQDPAAPQPLWYTNTSSGHVCSHRGDNGTVRFEIHQDGAHLACGLEFDNFIENNAPIYPAVPVGIHPSPPLDTLTHATVSFSAELLGAGDVRARCGSEPQCGGSGKIDYGYAVLGAVISNKASKQTFFYQVALGDTRDNTTCRGKELRNHCDKVAMSWYFNSNPFGANDSPVTLGYPCLGLGQDSRGARNRVVHYKLNVLPRYLQAFAEAPATMDTDPSHWQLDSVYLGLGLQGDVRQTLVVGDLSVTVGTKGDA